LFDWLPDVCRELRGNLVDVYWILLVPFAVFSICLEFFKFPEGNPSGGRVIKRVVVSLILLYSFEETMTIIAMISDGVTDKINGIGQMKLLLQTIGDRYKNIAINWLQFREAIIFTIDILSYIVAYLGVFVVDVLIHFVWSILYIVSPLMILMYVHEKTAFVTASLYRGLINVVTWKIFWSILAVLLLKMASSPQVAQDTNNFLTIVLMNLCIGLSMLFVPFATKSLLTNGMDSAASALAAAPATAALGAAKLYTTKFAKGAVGLGKDGLHGFPKTRDWVKDKHAKAKAGFGKARSFASDATDGVKKTAEAAHKFGLMEHVRPVRPPTAHRAQSPSYSKGPFGTGRKKYTESEDGE
jgi:hypothetical protein